MNGFGRSANFKIELTTNDRIVLRDLGPWDKYPTITNDAEHVLAYLVRAGQIGRNVPAKKVLYIDSDGELTVLHTSADGLLQGFGRPTSEDFAAIRPTGLLS